MSSLQRITVAGGGVLGSQIAWHCAFRGKTVCVTDVSASALDQCRALHGRYAEIYRSELNASDADIDATWRRLSYVGRLEDAVAAADLVIESVPEVPEVKTAFYRELAPLLPSHTLVATNSSTLLPSQFAESTGRPEKYCALHYANLIWTINILEIMGHPATARDTFREVTEFAIETGMLPVPIAKEQNGYVLNTWLVALLNAAQTLVTNGIATPADVDRTFMKAAIGATIGPFGIFDLIGMRTAATIFGYWGELLGDTQMQSNARYLQNHLVDEGRHGMLSGKGYYDYPDPLFRSKDFLEAPTLAAVADIVDRLTASPRP